MTCQMVGSSFLETAVLALAITGIYDISSRHGHYGGAGGYKPPPCQGRVMTICPVIEGHVDPLYV